MEPLDTSTGNRTQMTSLEGWHVIRYIIEASGRCGIRTHEAYAMALKTIPFDRSGNLPMVTVGFEPTKLTQWLLRPPPLTARESYRFNINKICFQNVF